MAVSKKARFEVFKRDGFACQYCGRTPPDVVLECDHILAKANGGQDEECNLITACFDCNRGKSDRPLTEAPASLKEQMAEQRERRAQMAEYNEFLMAQRGEAEKQAQELGYYWHNKYGKSQDRWVFASKRRASILGFMKRLPLAEIYEAMDVAEKIPATIDDDDARFRYFCGVCWSKIKSK